VVQLGQSPGENPDESPVTPAVLPGTGDGGAPPLKIFGYNNNGDPIYATGTGTATVGEVTKTSDWSGLNYSPETFPQGIGDPQAYVDAAGNKAFGYTNEDGNLVLFRPTAPTTALGEEALTAAAIALPIVQTAETATKPFTPLGWGLLAAGVVVGAYEYLSSDDEVPTVTVTANRDTTAPMQVPDEAIPNTPGYPAQQQIPSNTPGLPIADQGPTQEFYPGISNLPTAPPPSQIPDWLNLNDPLITPVPPSNITPNVMVMGSVNDNP
jgi:hypothetical protein